MSAEISLVFDSLSSASLTSIRFKSPLFETQKISVKGRSAGAYKAESTFQWTKGVRALTVLLLHSKYHWVTFGDVLKPALKGTRGSLAVSLDYALTKQPLWVCDVFGTDSRGQSLLKRILRVSNPNLKRGDIVALSLNDYVLHPSRIHLCTGEEIVESEAGVLQLLEGIEEVGTNGRASNGCTVSRSSISAQPSLMHTGSRGNRTVDTTCSLLDREPLFPHIENPEVGSVVVLRPHFLKDVLLRIVESCPGISTEQIGSVANRVYRGRIGGSSISYSLAGLREAGVVRERGGRYELVPSWIAKSERLFQCLDKLLTENSEVVKIHRGSLGAVVDFHSLKSIDAFLPALHKQFIDFHDAAPKVWWHLKNAWWPLLQPEQARASNSGSNEKAVIHYSVQHDSAIDRTVSSFHARAGIRSSLNYSSSYEFDFWCSKDLLVWIEAPVELRNEISRFIARERALNDFDYNSFKKHYFECAARVRLTVSVLPGTGDVIAKQAPPIAVTSLQ